MLLSYILPCYNTGQYLSDCIESLYRQNLDLSDFEVICVDNAATDNTWDILSYFQEKYNNFKTVRLYKNIFAGGAYNEGLKVAQGDFVQFVDSDDILYNNVEKKVLDIIRTNQLEILYFNIALISASNNQNDASGFTYNGLFKESIHCCNGEQFISQFLMTNDIINLPCPAYRKIIRKDFLILNKVVFTQSTIGTDFLHNIQLLSLSNKVAAITDDIYGFRLNPQGVTKTKTSSEKIIFALNNYCKASIIIDNSLLFSGKTKEVLQKEISRTLDSNIKTMIYLPNSKKKDVYNNIKYPGVLGNRINSHFSKIIVNHRILSMLAFRLINPRLCGLVRSIIK